MKKHASTKGKSRKPVIVYTLFPSNKATTGQTVLQSLSQFAQDAAKSYKLKDQQPLAVPDQLPNDSRAKDSHSIAAVSIFLDFDKPELSMKQVQERLERIGAAFAVYPTFSWKPDKPKYRVVLPLSGPIDLDLRRHLIARLGVLLPGVAPETSDTKRGYYIGRNGTTAPAPMYEESGSTAENLDLPDAPLPKKQSLPSGISVKDNPMAKAQELMAQYGHKLRDGEGRWTAVEFMATRMSARQYEEDQIVVWLGDMIARYFDARDVTDEDRLKWQSRIAYWLNKDAPKRVERMKAAKPVKQPRLETRNNLPTSFGLEELIKMDLPETQWILEDLLPPGLALIAGPPKAGKSQLMLDLALCVAGGKPFLGKYKSRQCKVIFFDLESGHELLRERVLPTMSARKITIKDVKGRMSFSLVMDTGADAIAQLRSELEGAPDVGLVVIDLFARIRDHENPQRKSVYQLDYDVLSRFQDVCADYPALCILLVHHTNKRSAGQTDHWQDSISGSHGIAGATHTNMAMSRISKQGLSEEDWETMKRYVTFHATGKRVKDTELILKQAGDGVSWAITDKSLTEIKTTTKQGKIVAVLKSDLERLWSAAEVAGTIGANVNTTKNVMMRLAAQKIIVCPTGKGYTLPEQAPNALNMRGPRVGGAKKGAKPKA